MQSIGELRRALGDDGPRLIRTVPRRGYRFTPMSRLLRRRVGHRPRRHQPCLRPAMRLLPRSQMLPRPRCLSPSLSPRLASACASGEPLRSRLPFCWPALCCRAVSWPRGSFRAFSGTLVAPRPTAWSSARIPRSPFFPSSIRATIRRAAYFADGLTQDVINALGRFSELTVMSWNAVAALQGQTREPRRDRPQPGVRYQVEGSVRQTGDRVRVTAQLVDADGRVFGPAVLTRRSPICLPCRTRSRRRSPGPWRSV